MATRRERVVVEAVDNYTGELLRMAAATETFRRSLDSSFSGSADSFRKVRTELDQTSRSFSRNSRQIDADSRRMSASIDQFSGRLSLIGRGVAALTPAVAPIASSLVPAIAGLSSQLGFAALAGGTMITAFQGVGDALEAVNEAAIDPTAENLAAAREQMALLSPAARDLVRQLSEMRPQFTALRDAAAGGLFPGLTEALGSAESLFPRLERILNVVGDASGDLLAGGAAELASDEWADFFSFVEAEARPTLTTLGETVGDVAKGVAELWMAMDPLSDDFTGGLRDAAADFEAWAEGLTATEGYAEFIAYVRETGPQVLDTVGSLANMLLQVAEAASPLGGPTLAAIEAIANGISAIADSNLGPPVAAIIALSSAVSLLGRAATAMRGVDMLSAVTGGLASSGGTGVIQSTRTQIRGLADDLKQVRAAGIGVGPLRGGQQAQMTSNFAAVAGGASLADVEARNRLNSSLRQTASLAGRAAGPMAGLALATSDFGEKSRFSNTATLALMGSFAGFPGMVGGAAVGAVLDLAAANDDLVGAINQVDVAIDSMDLDQLAAAQDNLNQKYAESEGFLGGLRATAPGVANLYDKLAGGSDDAAAAQSRLDGATQAAQRRLTDIRGVLPSVTRASGQFAARIEEQAAALRESRQAARETARGFITLGNGLDDAKVSLSQWIRQMANQAEALRNFRLNAERAANRGLREGLIQALREAGPEGALRMRQLANASQDEIGRANEAWRSGQREIKRYTDAANDVPEKKSTNVEALVDPALARLAAVRSSIDSIRDKSVTITTHYQSTGSPPGSKTFRPGLFSGGFTGNYAATDVAGVVHGREVVIPAWLAKRDAALLKARYGFLPGMTNLQGYFGGGFVDRRGHTSQGSTSVSVAAPNVSMSLSGAAFVLEVPGMGRMVANVVESRFADHNAHQGARSRTTYREANLD